MEKYSEWWSFKIFSPLGEYVNGRLSSYFRPEELIDLLIYDAQKTNSFDQGNSEIILNNNALLQQCFKTKILFTRDIYVLCLPHINILNDPVQLQKLRSNHIAADLWIETPYEILYQDPTAKFWLHPLYNQIMCKNKKMLYSWKELCYLITVYVSSPNEHFTSIGESLLQVNANSVFADEIRFKYFHKSQIPSILKQVTKYLGKMTNVLVLCPNLMRGDEDIKTSAFIEDTMFSNNRLLPHVPSFVYI